MGSNGSDNDWGLLTLDESPDARFDVVAVHGFNGHRIRSWSSSQGFLWLSRFREIGAAVYSYGYPSGTSHTSVAQDLIHELDLERSAHSSFKRPIIFLSHGLGGLIVKEALILLATYREESQTRILAYTRAIFFFSVQHRGLRGGMLKWVAATASVLPFGTIFRGRDHAIYPSRIELTRMVEAFAKISGGFEIFTLLHTLDSGPVDAMVGDPLDSLLGLPNERVIYINATYSTMSKFANHGDPDLQKIIATGDRIMSDLHWGSQVGHWPSDQLWRLDHEESVSAQQWHRDLEHGAHRVIEDRRKENSRRSRIAVIDSGIDWRHPAFKSAVEEGRIVCRSFVPGLAGDTDNCGHGTHAAHSILRTCPQSKLFIARVYDQGTDEEFDANTNAVAQAISWAMEANVDIISMSFGYQVESPIIKAAIRDAFHQGIILLAAASNSGVNPRFPVAFPANLRQVICVHSSDGDGNPSPRNPPATIDCSLAVLGEGVAAAWPSHLFTDRNDSQRVASGSSVATAVAAGLAALVLEYAAQGDIGLAKVQNWQRLRHCDEMRKVFMNMARERDGYLSIAPASLFDYHGERMYERISGRISDVLDSL